MTLIILVISAAVVVILLLVLFCLIILRKQNKSTTTVEMITGGREVIGGDPYHTEGLMGVEGDPDLTYVIKANPLYQPVCWEITLQDLRTGAVYRELFEQELYIGRYNQDHLPKFITILNYSDVSRTHIRVFQNNGNVYVMPMSATNPSWLNGQYLNQTALLTSGAVLKLASAELRVSLKKEYKRGR